jgi:glyoxylase-like metal-dependent hydrolase (beta-lactamase superfamily II)
LGTFLLGLALAAGAQEPDFEKVQIQTVPVAPGLSMLIGAGGNIAVSTGESGPIVVDDQFAPLAPKIAAAVKALQDAPVRFVINTHHHMDHTGGNEAFGKSGAVIVAHENVRVRMSTEQFSKLMNRGTPAAPAQALPVVTFADGVTFHWNGETIAVEHVANAHTDGDAVVWFRTANAVHAGDTFFNGFYPFIDVESGGSISGMIAAVDGVLAQANADTKIIPGHGPLAAPADLRTYRDMLATVRLRVQAAQAAKKAMPAYLAEKPLADLDPEWGDGFLKADQFLTLVWMDLQDG